MGEELLISCDNQEEWDDFIEKSPKVVVSFITSNSPSRGAYPDHERPGTRTQEIKNAIKFLQVDVNNFKPKQTSFTVTEVPSVMFVMNTNQQFGKISDLNAEKLKKKITDLAGLKAN